ncbi:MAG: polymer-forming cytoskeletal protein [Spirochaetaceae bacterium]|nr:polymer-forming cytoskeletal protein [Spirochaetaceae bacterium]MCF7946974.1 polymer-forming cytoskeletal protein [Spirochaetia bacterium]MCF7951093.1 polymer-forming cytoskeletal protein [Spirochaetaceae bacterium]
MSEQLDLNGVFINSIIGEGAAFSGDISMSGLFRIDGDFRGNIEKADKVLIGRNGRAECSIYAGTVVVGGVVKGDIYSTEKVVVLSTGMVLGNVTTPRLLVEDGVVLNGRCKIISFQEEQKNRESDSSDSVYPQDTTDQSIDRYNPLYKSG